MKKRTLTKASIEELSKEMPVLNEAEQRSVIGGGDTYLGDPVYNISEYLTMAVSGSWEGGFVNHIQ